MNRLSILAALWLLGATLPCAAEEASASSSASRYSLRQVRAEASTVSDSGRYSVRARFAPAENAGELREGEHYTLIGRFAKAGSGCSAEGTIFRDGFESP